MGFWNFLKRKNKLPNLGQNVKPQQNLASTSQGPYRSPPRQTNIPKDIPGQKCVCGKHKWKQPNIPPVLKRGILSKEKIRRKEIQYRRRVTEIMRGYP